MVQYGAEDSTPSHENADIFLMKIQTFSNENARVSMKSLFSV